MRKSLPALALVLLVIISASCSKIGELRRNGCNDAQYVDVGVAPKPEASFRVTNLVNGVIQNNKSLVLENLSQHAETYSWDFGNGVTSAEKTPTNVTISACPGSVTITLTAKNKHGEISKQSQTISVVCGG
jgi:PKD repeat protein